MPVNMAGPLLMSSAFNEFRPLGVMGQPVHLSHRKIITAIRARLGDDFTKYLARPEIDDSNRKIHWHSEVDGEVRRWDALTDAERQAAAPQVTAMRDGFLSFVSDLENRETGNRSDQGFAHLVRQSLKSPGMQTLYMVGDQPVLALWGFEGDETPFDTLGFSAIGGELPSVIPAAATGATILPPVAAASRPWWRWLLWWLLFLLALALLFWILRACGQLPEDLPFTDPTPPTEDRPLDPVQPDDPAVRVGPDGTVIGPDGTGVVEGPSADGTGTALPPAEGQLEGDITPEIPGEGEQPADPSATEPPKPEGDVTDPDAPTDQPTEPEMKPEDPPKPEGTDDQPEPEPEEPPAPEPKPEDPPQDPPATDQKQPEDTPPDQPQPDQPQPGDDKPLEIPPAQSGESGAGGVGFLQGEWKSDGGLVDEKSGKPLDQRYKFDDKGEGEVIIRQGDGSQCRGGAKATRTADGGLRITETGPLACGDGSSYAPSVTECKQSATGKTICTGVNPDGSTYNVEVTK